MKLLRSEGGQMTVEMVLLAALAVFVTLLVSQQMRQQQVMKTIVSGPWSHLKNMNEHGVWTANATQAKQLNPNGVKRIGTPKGAPTY